MSIDQQHSVAREAAAEQPVPQSLNSPNTSGDGESKYQRLVEGISGDYVIYTHDPDGLITYVSPSIETVLGYPAQAVIGLNWRDLIGERFVGRELADRVEGDVAAGKDFHRFTTEISHADGSRRLIEIQQRPLFDSAGQYLSMEGIAKDITEATRNAEELHKLKQELELRVAERTTELIRANERLRESEARYRSVVQCQTEFVVRWLPGAIFTFANEAFCRLVGRTREELIGWCFLPIVHDDDIAIFQTGIDALNRNNPVAIGENRILTPDGSARWTHWANQMLFDEEGQFLEYQSVGRDVTELKEAADTIREKEVHLAHVSRLATMGELVAGMAHEVHQPLHAAKTFAEAARRNLELGKDSNIAAAIDCTNEISSAITRTATIIRRLREFTRPHSIVFERLDLNRVLGESCELIAFETRKARVKLEFDLERKVPLIQGDRVQLQQVCINLLINAYDAMAEIPPHKRRVLVSSRYDFQWIRLEFCDAGCGTADENMEKLFDAFFSTKPEGMGMGLSLCKSIAETHGGTITAKQNQESGMTFTLELPVVQRLTSTPLQDELENNGEPNA